MMSDAERSNDAVNGQPTSNPPYDWASMLAAIDMDSTTAPSPFARAARLEMMVLRQCAPTDADSARIQRACEMDAWQNEFDPVDVRAHVTVSQRLAAGKLGDADLDRWLAEAYSINDSVGLYLDDLGGAAALFGVWPAPALVDFLRAFDEWELAVFAAGGVDVNEFNEPQVETRPALVDADHFDALPSTLRDRLPDLAARLRVSFDPALLSGTRALERAWGVSRVAVKQLAVEAGAIMAWEQRTNPWVPRRDSQSEPIVPCRDLSAAEFTAWLEREALKAAKCYLKDVPYPLSSGPELVLDGGAKEDDWLPESHGEMRFANGGGDVGRNSMVDMAALRYEQEYGSDFYDGDYVDLNDEYFGRGAELERRRARRDEGIAALGAVLTEAQDAIAIKFLELASSSREMPTWADVARALGKNPGVVTTQMSRIRRRLGIQLKASDAPTAAQECYRDEKERRRQRPQRGSGPGRSAA